MTIIKNIIFDLGGVLLQTNHTLTIEALQTANKTDIYEVMQESIGNNFFFAFEKGEISPENFRKSVKQRLEMKVLDNEFDRIWNKMLVKWEKTIIDKLILLKNKYRFFLLSNTNEIHYKAFLQMLKNELNINGLSELFENSYMSFSLGMRKPEPAIYQYVLNKNMLSPNQTLFIDDDLQNILSAEKEGIQTFHKKDYNSLMDLLDQL